VAVNRPAGAPSSGLYFSHPACLEHDPRVLSPGHPDTPERLETLEAALRERDWLGWERRAAPRAGAEQLELAHSARHVSAIQQLSAAGGGAIDPDTFVIEASWAAALHAAGGACEMTRALLAGEAQAGFCGIRPSGHHAEHDRAMGFCLFNNVAVAAATAIVEQGVKRVFVLDWDVHHGNGTAEIFYRRSDVLFVSIHQSPLYPGSGALEESGSGEGEGFTVNLPVPPGSEEALWLALMDRVILPAARSFAPDLVLVSAGFDAHRDDPLAGCRLSVESFVQLAARTRDLARALDVPLGVVMEGGYDRDVLAECVCAILPVLAGEEGVAGEPSAGVPAPHEALLERAVVHYGRYWPLG
jgi:acetoin utilization deacetylase AcuC-like enzyme